MNGNYQEALHIIDNVLNQAPDFNEALFSTTFECDQKHGTEYHQRFSDYWKWIQKEDLVVDGAMTDPKGDRGKRPKDQADPDLYLRVKERQPGGVVISGAKLHQTGMLNSHEILIMPTLTLRSGEEDWAICCSITTNTMRLIENLVAGAGAVGYLIESMHGAGPPTAQRIMISRQTNLEDKIKRVKDLLGIS